MNSPRIVVDGSSAAWVIVALALALLGSWLRLAILPSQILGGDELHMLTAAAERPLAELLGYHAPAENCIPLTLYARVLMELGALNELNVRLPAIVAGLLLLLAPWLWLRILGPGACAIATCLLAVWPMCLYYSFVARPYAPAALLLLFAGFCWQRWVTDGRRRYLYLFSVLAALSAYFHLLCTFPVLWLLFLSWLEERKGVVARRDLRLAVSITAAMAGVLLGPGARGLIEYRLLDESRPAVGTLATVWQGFVNLAGSEIVSALVLLTAAVAGAIQLHRSHPTLARGLAGTPLVMVLGLLATQPFPTVTSWTRYQYLTWPVVVILSAVATDSAVRWLARRGLTGSVLSALAGLVGAVCWWNADPDVDLLLPALWPWLVAPPLLAGGAAGLLRRLPLRAETAQLRQRRWGFPFAHSASAGAAMLLAMAIPWQSPAAIFFAGRDDFRARRTSVMSRYSERARTSDAQVSPFFFSLVDREDAGEAIVVWPFDHRWRTWDQVAADQRVHQKRVYVATPKQIFEVDGVALRQTARLDDQRWLGESGARFLVVDLDMLRGRFSENRAKRQLKTLRRRYGRPVYRDQRIVVYDL